MSGNLWRESLTMLGAVCLAVTECKAADQPATPARTGRFESDVAFLRQHGRVVLLTDRYKGDVINSYNDGPPAPDKPPLGPFFELETSSPALDLLPAQHYTHVHRTFHLVGPEAELDRIARATINVGLDELVNAFSARR